MQTPDFQIAGIENIDYQTTDFRTTDLQNPDFQTPDFQTAAYVDTTYTLKNTGNVTTTFSADMTFTGVDPDDLTAAQLIAWTTYLTTTSRGCEVNPQWQTQVISSENLSDEQLQTIVLPSVDDPFAGPVTFPLVPGQTINITLRLIAERDESTGESVLDNLTPADFQAGTGFAASAHSCSDPSAIDFDVDCLTLDEEVIRIDNTPPVITVPPDPVISVEADRPGGACVDVTSSGLGLVTAEDDGVPVDVVCIADSTGGPVCTTDPSSAELPLPLNDPSTDPTTLLTCSATDAAGNTASVDLEVQVEDNTPPELPSPFDMPPVFVDVDAAVGEDSATADFGPFVATDTVAGDITMTCSPESGTFAFPIGETAVTCEAIDDGFNACAFQDPSACTEPPGDGRNRVAGTLTVRVADTTPPTGSIPTITTFEANTAGGANADYALPVFNDNFDPEPLEASCTPPPGSFFALEDNTGDGVLDPTVVTISCSATDAGLNTGSLDFDITIQDTTPPTIEAAAGVSFPIEVAVGSSGSGSLDFEAQVVATDVDGVDPDPSLSCSAGGAGSGDSLTIGSYTVSCTATDASGNSSPAFDYEVIVGFGNFVGVSFNKGKVNAGSTVPTTFGWAGESGDLINSSSADPLVSALNCATGEVVLNPGEFPGNSDLRWDGSARLWKFNWQTVLPNGDPIPAARGGTDYCLTVTSQRTGQVFPSNEGPITVRP
jgi:hypothetical protein